MKEDMPASASVGEGFDQVRTTLVVTEKTFRVEVYLPPRSVYIMSGDSRIKRKHGIMQNNEARRSFFPPIPSWNPHFFRRSGTPSDSRNSSATLSSPASLT